MRSVSIRIFGTVQGVFFRHHTHIEAEKLGLKGFVQNEPDGSVLVEAEGEGANIQKLIEWCGHGPENARVRRTDVAEQQPRGYEMFEIRR